MYQPLSEQEQEALRRQLAEDRTIVLDILNHLQELLREDEADIEREGVAA